MMFKKNWLRTLLALLVLMVAVGGITRLTRSGLSITEWKPISGIIPPIDEASWQENFSLYKNSPQFQQVNSDMNLPEYKKIFLWEYVHRLLGRIIFLWALFPAIYLYRKKEITIDKLVLFPALIASQGLIGWLMVKSGLKDIPQVSPYMLSLHFVSAVVVILVVYYELVRFRTKLVFSNALLLANWKKIFFIIGAMLFLQVFYGNLTSGFKAGFSYNTFPLMGEQFFPAAAWNVQPSFLNIFANPVCIQWIHRWLGISFFCVLVYSIFKMKKENVTILKGPLFHLAGVVGLQLIIGILNIIFVVPVPLAVFHQLMACLIIMAFANIWFRLQTGPFA